MITLVAVLCFVAAIGQASEASAVVCEAPWRDPGPFPVLLERTKPEYPVDLWKTGNGCIVSISVGLDSTAAVTSTSQNQGWSPFTELALAALQHWKYRPAKVGDRSVASYDQVVFWFDPDQSIWSEEEARIIDVQPQPLVPVPFNCPDGSEAVLVKRYSNDFVCVRVDTSGFVREARFFMSAPPDSESVRKTAVRWIFRPFVAPDGPHAGRAIPFWAAIRIMRSCSHNGQRELLRPDSLMLVTLNSVQSFRVAKLHPSPRNGGTLAGESRALPHPAATLSLAQVIPGFAIQSSETESFREVSADSVTPVLTAILKDPRVRRASRPPRTGQVPEPAYVLKWWDYELLVSPAAETIHVWNRRTMLEVDYRSHRREVQGMLKVIFPD